MYYGRITEVGPCIQSRAEYRAQLRDGKLSGKIKKTDPQKGKAQIQIHKMVQYSG